MAITTTSEINKRAAGKWQEVGSSGLDVMMGFVNEAHTTELKWPQVEPLYNRIWRSDPEVTIARSLLSAWAGNLSVGWELPAAVGGKELPDPTDDDKRALDFAWEVIDDIENGINHWLTSCLSRVPFYGWGFWEAVPALRRLDWRPPEGDPWRSEYNDGLIGYRRLAFRRYPSFMNWDIDDRSGRVDGFVQYDPPNEQVTIPTDRALHVKFGDLDNPEGLATLEALWRLERIKRGLEVVMGIGFEHSAGHLSVTVEDAEDFDDDAIARAARNILTAQEGNYAAWPAGVTGEVIDVPFSAAESIISAIKHYAILKLSLFGMQWVAFSTISGVGSLASMTDASSLSITLFNSMAKGFVQQADEQIGKRLFNYKANQDAFPNMSRRPRLIVDELQKEVDIAALGQFITSLGAVLPITEGDAIAIRERSGILPPVVDDDVVVSEPANQDQNGEGVDQDDAPIEDEQDESEQTGDDAEGAELARRPILPSPEERATDVLDEAVFDPESLTRRILRIVKRDDPELYEFLVADELQESEQDEDET